MQPPRHFSAPAPSRPPSLPRASQSPEAHSWRFPLRYPADPANSRPGKQGREGKGAAEVGAAACRRAPRPDTKRSARPPPPVPTQSAGLGAPPGCDPTYPRTQVSPPWPSRWLEALPGQTPPRRYRESKSKRRCPGGAGEPRTATHPGAQELPGSLRSAVEGRPQAPAGDQPGGGASSGRERVGVRTPRVRPGVSSAGLSCSGFGAAPRILAGFRAEDGLQATNGDPAGGLAARPTHL